MLALGLGAAAAGADEIYKWTDASGNVHFGNRKPGAARSVETVEGGTVNQADDAKPTDSRDRADRLKRLQRENKKSERSSSKPVILGSGMRPVDPDRQDPMKSESYCQSTYGKSCSDLENWRERAVEKCENKNSAHCKDEGYIDAQKPKTLEEQRWLEEEREKNARARYNRANNNRR